MIHFISGKPHIFWNISKEKLFFDFKIWNINFKKKLIKQK